MYRMEGTHFIERKEGGEKAVFLQAREAQFSSSQALPSIPTSFIIPGRGRWLLWLDSCPQTYRVKGEQRGTH